MIFSPDEFYKEENYDESNLKSLMGDAIFNQELDIEKTEIKISSTKARLFGESSITAGFLTAVPLDEEKETLVYVFIVNDMIIKMPDLN
jgi:hypothetical protein